RDGVRDRDPGSSPSPRVARRGACAHVRGRRRTGVPRGRRPGAHGGWGGMTDDVLVLAWLVLAHLIADFVLQNDWIAINKATGGREGWAALSVHGFHVAITLLPVVFAWGIRGFAYVVVVALTHMAVDRWKVRATRRSERSALEAAVRRHAGRPDTTPSGLGVAWTPWPGMLFLADQVLHLTIAIVGWLVILQGIALTSGFVDAVNRVLGVWDRATVHAVVLTGVVMVSLF